MNREWLTYLQETQLPDRTKPRKSVAFSDETTLVDTNGEVTEMNGAHGDKDSAHSHSKPGSYDESTRILDRFLTHIQMRPTTR